MTQTNEVVKDEKGNRFVSFTLGANDITIFSGGGRQYIVAKGAVTHVIEDPDLVARLLAKYSPGEN